MPERAEIAEGGEGGDGIGPTRHPGGAPQVLDPVIEIVLDPSATDEQRHGVDDEAHSP
jgi:hypothetical protein